MYPQRESRHSHLHGVPHGYHGSSNSNDGETLSHLQKLVPRFWAELRNSPNANLVLKGPCHTATGWCCGSGGTLPSCPLHCQISLARSAALFYVQLWWGWGCPDAVAFSFWSRTLVVASHAHWDRSPAFTGAAQYVPQCSSLSSIHFVTKTPNFFTC